MLKTYEINLVLQKWSKFFFLKLGIVIELIRRDLLYILQYFFLRQSGIKSCHLFLSSRVSEANKVPIISHDIGHLGDIETALKP